jgi:hypothetical protein
MSTKRIPRPRDPLALAKLVGDIATGQLVDEVQDKRDERAVERGRLGGMKGGVSRAASMTDGERSDSSRKAARARWAKNNKKTTEPAN